jgi:penicillin-binding protein 1B
MMKIKRHLSLFFTLTTLMIILISVAIGIWFWNLRTEVSNRLESKKFLPPTEYYAAPEEIRPQQSSFEAFQKNLQQRGYNLVQSERPLNFGEYRNLDLQNCKNLAAFEVQSDVMSCTLLMTKETLDPEFKERELQWVGYNQNQLVVQTARGNPLKLANAVLLEPMLVAQFIGNDPILQSFVELGQIPTQCLNAVIAIEDNNYLEHKGFSPTGLLRAVYKNIRGGGYAQGGSTITQQLVKNYFLTPEKTLQRKIKELAMAIALEEFISKDQIFSTYLNIIYLGQNGAFQIRGVGSAAQYYFSKPIFELDLSECSLMAALLNSPGQFNPLTKPENAKKRRTMVLKKMLENGFISETERQQTELAPLPRKSELNISETAPYYFDYVRKELATYNIETTGKIIFTGLNVTAQFNAQSALSTNLERLESANKRLALNKSKGANLEGLFLAANNSSGLIEAIVGGRNFKRTQFNRAWEAHRQIGSVIKPFVFLTALIEKPNDYSALTELQDRRMTISFEGQSWTPDNYDNKYFEVAPMYVALKNSLNSATASLGWSIGLDKIIALLKKMKITSDIKPVPSLTLGSFEMYPKEVLGLYQTIARLGVYRQASSVRYVLDQNQQLIWENKFSDEEILPANTAAELVSMMAQTTISGSGRAIKNSGYAPYTAGKTGTTSDSKDTWFAGFTPETTAITWMGYDDNRASGLTGASGAVPVWLSYMQKQHALDSADFKWPAEVHDVEHNWEHEGRTETAKLKMRK